MRIAFLGLGIMGSRMAANLLKAGHSLSVWNRSPGKDETLVEAGARRAVSPADAANGADVLVSMLSTPEVVEQTALGEAGFLAALPQGALWIDSSTVNPSFSRRMAQACAEHGLRLLDAPVTGSKAAAESGQLVFLVGGVEADLETARPLFEVMGRAVIHVGVSGMGSALKVVNNMLAAQAARITNASQRPKRSRAPAPDESAGSSRRGSTASTTRRTWWDSARGVGHSLRSRYRTRAK